MAKTLLCWQNHCLLTINSEYATLTHQAEKRGVYFARRSEDENLKWTDFLFFDSCFSPLCPLSIPAVAAGNCSFNFWWSKKQISLRKLEISRDCRALMVLALSFAHLVFLVCWTLQANSEWPAILLVGEENWWLLLLFTVALLVLEELQANLAVTYLRMIFCLRD